MTHDKFMHMLGVVAWLGEFLTQLNRRHCHNTFLLCDFVTFNAVESAGRWLGKRLRRTSRQSGRLICILATSCLFTKHGFYSFHVQK